MAVCSVILKERLSLDFNFTVEALILSKQIVFYLINNFQLDHLQYPKYEGFFPGVVKVQGHGVFQIG